MAEALNKSVHGAINVTFGPFNGYVYFFHEDGTYSRFNRVTCELEYYAETVKNWTDWPSDWAFPQACLTWDNQAAYFLRSPDYFSYDLIADQASSLVPFAPDWVQWPQSWLDRIDAGLYWGYHFGQKRRKAYFFRDDEYLRYDVQDDRVEDGYPLNTRKYWPNWPSHWKNVSAAVDWGNGKVYFFFGMEYLRYDKFFESVDKGYPRPLGDFLKEHRDKLDSESKSLLFENQIPAPQRASFVATVRALAKELELRPNWLMASMWMESGFDPKAGLLAGNFIGLHQMSLAIIYALWGKTALPAILPGLFNGQPFGELTPEAKRALAEGFAALGFGQITFVASWLRSSLKALKATCRSFDQLRLIGFGGVGLAQVDRKPLASVVAKGNPRYDLTKDGKLDVAEFRAAVFDILHEKLKTKPGTDSEVRHALG